MRRSIGKRQIVSVTVDGHRLSGTFHLPPCQGGSPPSRRTLPGVLFLNPGVLPRSANGDSAVYWAESLALAGYSAFRFDLPGLGDSDGEPPSEVIDFQHLVNAGHYGPVVSALVKELAARFSMPGIIVVGHCAGAVSALYAAPETPEIKGLVLLDPYFFLQREITSRNLLCVWQMKMIRRLEEADLGAKDTLREQHRGLRIFSYTSRAYDRLKSFRLLLRRNKLPKNANLPLIRCWNRLVSAGLPMLVLKAPALAPKVGEFDYLGYLQSTLPANSVVTANRIEGTNHSFAEGTGKEEVRRHIEQWLRTGNPAAQGKQSLPAYALQVN
jgi:pimeloyl-ACP methyl ester carboxylesterase